MIQTADIEPVPIPESLRSILAPILRDRSFGEWATEAIVVEAVRDGIISRNKAATMLGLDDYQSRESFFDRHRLLIEYTEEMVDQDFQSIIARRASR